MSNTHQKGTFAYDLEFLQTHYDNLAVLSDGDRQIIVCAELQGRVMTSTCNGGEGRSYGWINHEYIAAGKLNNQFNPFGGEDRFWLGPEAGQFGIFFPPGKTFEFANWQVPASLDTQPFTLVDADQLATTFEKDMRLENYARTIFDLRVKRTIRLLSPAVTAQILQTTAADVRAVGFESINSITNAGKNTWDRDSGMPSIWILSMLNASPSTVIMAPYRQGEPALLGDVVTADYFGAIPADRLALNNGVIYFKADAKWRSKLGLSAKRALPVMGSYDTANKVLTIAQFDLPEHATDYVNSLWKIQEQPFAGDVSNAYNDGPLESGGQLGAFYELESSSPAANLSAGETLTHAHRIIHLEGAQEQLNAIAKTILGADLNRIEQVFAD